MLINCPTCRKLISNYRSNCPHCYVKVATEVKTPSWWRFILNWFRNTNANELVNDKVHA